jgi:Flp pilus assembly protein TadD
MTQDPKGAVADLDEAIRLDPNDSGAHLNRGVALAFLNEHRRALADYDEAIRLNPKHPLGSNGHSRSSRTICLRSKA